MGGSLCIYSCVLFEHLKSQWWSLWWELSIQWKSSSRQDHEVVAAKSLQSCPTLVTHRRQPTRLPGAWDSPGKNTGVGCHFLLQCMKVKSESESLSRVWLLATPWTAAHQDPPSMRFSWQECWSGVPLPSLHEVVEEIKCKQVISMSKLYKNPVLWVKHGTMGAQRRDTMPNSF